MQAAWRHPGLSVPAGQDFRLLLSRLCARPSWIGSPGSVPMCPPDRDPIQAAAPRPELIIAGGAVPDEPVAARWFRSAAPATVRIWVVPGAGHTAALAAEPRAWETRVTSFLATALHPAGA